MMEDMQYVDYDGTIIDNILDNFGNDVNMYGDNSLQEKMDIDSNDSIDYSDYFDNIIDHFETLVSYDSETDSQITLNDIHNDLKLIMLLLVCLFITFVGHGFVNRFRI